MSDKRYKVGVMPKRMLGGRCISRATAWVEDKALGVLNNKVAVFWGNESKVWAKEFAAKLNGDKLKVVKLLTGINDIS